jgi:hypothetical protein
MLPLFEESAARMSPARNFDDWARLGAGGAHVRRRAGGGAIGAVEVGGGWRRLAAKAPIVAHVDPEPSCLGSVKAGLEHRNGRIVAMVFIGGKYMHADGGTIGSSSQAAWPTQLHNVERSTSRPSRA